MKWTEESIRLMEAAASRSSYYGALADVICAALPAGSRICDAGCGLGHLSMALAARGMRVTSVDTSADALAVLARLRGQADIDIRCGRIEDAAPDIPYDAMIFCLFGSIGEIVKVAAAQCRGDVFIVARNDSAHRFSVRRHALPDPGYGDMRQALGLMGVPHTGTALSLEIGQPLRDFDDARRFFALYNRDDPSLITDEYLSSRLVRTGDPAYPLYLPHAREIGVIHFSAHDIRAR